MRSPYAFMAVCFITGTSLYCLYRPKHAVIWKEEQKYISHATCFNALLKLFVVCESKQTYIHLACVMTENTSQTLQSSTASSTYNSKGRRHVNVIHTGQAFYRPLGSSSQPELHSCKSLVTYLISGFCTKLWLSLFHLTRQPFCTVDGSTLDSGKYGDLQWHDIYAYCY